MSTRRDFIARTIAIAAFAAVHSRSRAASIVEPRMRLKAPANEHIKVAFAINENANVMDIAGPWEVFQDVHVEDRGSSHAQQMPFRLYTVSPDGDKLRATGGLQIVPDYAVADAPQPNIVVVPAQRAHDEMLAWLESISAKTDVTMSVCTGAFQLGRAGLLSGLTATTHHDFYNEFSKAFPDVELVRDRRYVEHERIATAGGLTSGIDLALRTVARYFGEPVAAQTAEYMEYAGDGWRDPVVNAGI